MIYPKFIKKGEKLGIFAPSAGVGYKIDDYNKSINNLKKYFNLVETKSVRVNNEISNTGENRAKELDSLVLDDNVHFILSATGGDYAIEMLPYINYDNIKNNPKWYMGYSDPTSFLYSITTNLDIATMYGFNAGSFDQTNMHESLNNCISFMQGNIVKQDSFEKYEAVRDKTVDGYNLTSDVKWENLNNIKEFEGRLLGGCLDCILDILGTKYDGTIKYIEKYKDDGIIWFFDVFSLDTDTLYRALFHMNELGYFKYTKAVIVGRVCIPNSYSSFSYEDVLKRIFKDIPVVFNADIGHVAPKFTLINGAYANVYLNNNKGSIIQTLKP